MKKVSVVILAYNKLPYTQLCIDSLYKFTSHIDFELITVNNGSTDGTREYFDSLPNEKKIHYDVNVGIEKAINDALNVSEGEYFALVNNDIILTENWLDNLIKVMESDPKIGAVVPTCNITVNDQATRGEYCDTLQLQEFASKYNKSNPRKWEERLTLTMYLVLFRTNKLKQLGGLDLAYSPGGYDDDDLSFRYRRAGFKTIFTSDTYVHHYGGITMREFYGNNSLMTRNLKFFISKFGVNIYEVISLDYRVLNTLDYNKSGKINILGIGKSCGNTILRVKNKLKQREEIEDIILSYYCLDEKNLIDLKTICNNVFFNSIENLGSELQDNKFDYIHIEEKMDKIEHLEELLKVLSQHLNDNGEIIFFFSNINLTKTSENDTCLYFKENLDRLLNEYGFIKLVAKVDGGEYMYIISIT